MDIAWYIQNAMGSMLGKGVRQFSRVLLGGRGVCDLRGVEGFRYITGIQILEEKDFPKGDFPSPGPCLNISDKG